MNSATPTDKSAISVIVPVTDHSARRRLIENVVSLTALQALNYLVPLVTLPYLVRVLGPSTFGLMAFAQSIVLYFDFFTDFGFNFTAVRAIAGSGQSITEVNRIFWTTLCAKCLLLLLSGLALFLLVATAPGLRATPLLYTVNFLYVVGTTFLPVWLFQGLERMKLAAAIYGSARLLTIPAILFFVKTSGDIVTAAMIQAGVDIVATLIAVPIVFRRLKVGWYPPSVNEIRQSIAEAWPLFVMASTLFLSTSITIPILGVTSGNAEVGYFSAADKLIRAAILVSSPLSQAVYPRLNVLRRESRSSAIRLVRTNLVVTGSISAAVALLIFLFAEPCCVLLLGASFRRSAIILKCLAPLPFLYGMISVLGTQTMLAFQMERPLSRILGISTAAGVVFTVVLSARWESIGASAALVLSALIAVMMMIFVLRSRGLAVWQRTTPN